MARPKGSRNYSDQERAHVLTTLTINDGNVKKTSREVGVPESTVRLWKKEWDNEGVEESVALVASVEADAFLGRAITVRDAALTQLEAKLPEAKVGELNAVVGTLTDKIDRASALSRRNPEGDDGPHQIDARAAGELLAGFIQEARRMATSREEAIHQATESKQPALPAKT